jgi:thiamine-phosphate pyrophosphorylase
MFPAVKIYPITDVRISGLSHVEQVTRLIQGGATLIQLREKDLPPHEFYTEAEAAIKIARSKGARIIINDRVDIALALKADGVHLGQDDLPVTAARKILGEHALIGYSTHNLEQAVTALGLPIDYLAFGPIFPTSSKKAAEPTVGLESLKRVRALTKDLPLVAIGGITANTLQKALLAGANCVAVIGAALANSAGIVAATRDLITRASTPSA